MCEIDDVPAVQGYESSGKAWRSAVQCAVRCVFLVRVACHVHIGNCRVPGPCGHRQLGDHVTL